MERRTSLSVLVDLETFEPKIRLGDVLPPTALCQPQSDLSRAALLATSVLANSVALNTYVAISEHVCPHLLILRYRGDRIWSNLATLLNITDSLLDVHWIAGNVSGDMHRNLSSIQGAQKVQSLSSRRHISLHRIEYCIHTFEPA